MSKSFIHHLTRVTIVDEACNVVFDSLVEPDLPITDYLTQFSGITPKLLAPVTTKLDEVQSIIKRILPPDAILCGHSFNFDLKALRMFHPFVIDLSIAFNLSGDKRLKSSLSTLAATFLGEVIQSSSKGHCSIEDAVTTMKLLKVKLQKGLGFGSVVNGWQYQTFQAMKQTGLLASSSSSSEAENSQGVAKNNVLLEEYKLKLLQKADDKIEKCQQQQRKRKHSTENPGVDEEPQAKRNKTQPAENNSVHGTKIKSWAKICASCNSSIGLICRFDACVCSSLSHVSCHTCLIGTASASPKVLDTSAVEVGSPSPVGTKAVNDDIDIVQSSHRMHDKIDARAVADSSETLSTPERSNTTVVPDEPATSPPADGSEIPDPVLEGALDATPDKLTTSVPDASKLPDTSAGLNKTVPVDLDTSLPATTAPADQSLNNSSFVEHIPGSIISPTDAFNIPFSEGQTRGITQFLAGCKRKLHWVGPTKTCASTKGARSVARAPQITQANGTVGTVAGDGGAQVGETSSPSTNVDESAPSGHLGVGERTDMPSSNDVTKLASVPATEPACPTPADNNNNLNLNRDQLPKSGQPPDAKGPEPPGSILSQVCSAAAPLHFHEDSIPSAGARFCERLLEGDLNVLQLRVTNPSSCPDMADINRVVEEIDRTAAPQSLQVIVISDDTAPSDGVCMLRLKAGI